MCALALTKYNIMVNVYAPGLIMTSAGNQVASLCFCSYLTRSKSLYIMYEMMKSAELQGRLQIMYAWLAISYHRRYADYARAPHTKLCGRPPDGPIATPDTDASLVSYLVKPEAYLSTD